MRRLLKLITFDVNRTILRVKHSPGHQYSITAQEIGLETKPEHLNIAFNKVYRSMKQNLPNYGIDYGYSSKEWWTELVMRVFLTAGYVDNTQLIAQMASKIYDDFSHSSRWQVFPETLHVLSELKSTGVRLAVVSNMDERVEEILRNTGLSEYFDFVINSVTVKIKKPSPEIFHLALQKSKVNAEEAGHVGDNVQEDYWGARNVGMMAFLLNRENSLKPGDLEDINPKHILQNLSCLERLLLQNSDKN